MTAPIEPTPKTAPRPRRVLMIAAAFPPTGGPGVQRTAKFAKYLPSCGWLPTVWTMDRLEGLPEDPSLLKDLPPEVIVQRWNRGKSRRKLQKFLQRRASGHGTIARMAKAMDWRMEVNAARQLWPDDCVGWAKASERALLRFLEDESIDLIYSTYSPASNHLLALALKQRTGLPWVADFRDLWTKDFRYGQRSAKWRQDDARLEQEILSTADRVIGVTEKQTDILTQLSSESNEKFRTITNGFDPADFETPPPTSAESRDWFVLAHVGRLDKNGANDSWFEGLRRFVGGLGGRRDSVQLRIVGHANPNTLARLKQTGVWYAFTGYESHTAAINEMRSADALMLLVSDQVGAESIIPAKLFEYLATGNPILLSGPAEGACTEIIRRCQAGLCVAPDPQEIADALQRLHKLWSNGKPMSGCSRDKASTFSRVHLTRDLADIFNELVPSESRPQPVQQEKRREVSV